MVADSLWAAIARERVHNGAARQTDDAGERSIEDSRPIDLWPINMIDNEEG